MWGHVRSALELQEAKVERHVPGPPQRLCQIMGTLSPLLLLGGQHLEMMTASIPAHFPCLHWQNPIETVPPM